jgi:hypothetical protein
VTQDQIAGIGGETVPARRDVLGDQIRYKGACIWEKQAVSLTTEEQDQQKIVHLLCRKCKS